MAYLKGGFLENPTRAYSSLQSPSLAVAYLLTAAVASLLRDECRLLSDVHPRSKSLEASENT
jgi:hypothetical protein